VNRRFQRATEAVERQIRGEHVLVPLADNPQALDSLFSLNETASIIWQMAAAGASEDTINQYLADKYDAAPERIRADTRDVLDQLVAHKLLKEIQDKPAP
jgi:uncharacterized protein YeeX (DUF496 family)